MMSVLLTPVQRPDHLRLEIERLDRSLSHVGLLKFLPPRNRPMTNSYLPLALATGNLTVLTECEAIAFEERASGQEFRARALQVVLRDFSTGVAVARPTIRARYFILAPGAVFSSALLLQTRALARERVGRKVWLQPHAVVHALFDEPVTMRGRLEAGRYLPFNGVRVGATMAGLTWRRPRRVGASDI